MNGSIRLSFLWMIIAMMVYGCSTGTVADGSRENPFQVSTFEDLLAIAEEYNLDKHFVQVNDIDAASSEGMGVNYGEIRDSYALADVSRHDWVVGTGGLVGENRGGTITRSFATGKISAYDDVDTDQGGFAGVNTGNISVSYWNSETSGFERGVGDGDADGAAGLTTQQMTGSAAQDHMPEFDWSTVWRTTSGYPILRWQVEN